MWLVWHHSITVNAWRGRINGDIDTLCLVWATGCVESILHRFLECPSTCRAWKWGTHIMHRMLGVPFNEDQSLPFTWSKGFLLIEFLEDLL
jgi:hypothetical protein